jgi:adenylate kinase
MSLSVIFIGGIHGVGKGYMAAKLSEDLGVPAYSASELIKNEKNAPVDISKVVLDASDNQDHLVLAVNKLEEKHDVVILDGHFVLLGDDGFFDIPQSTFEGLSISAIVLMVDNVNIIRERLLLRDKDAPSLVLLEKMQRREKLQAEKSALNLGVNILTSVSGDYEAAIQSLKRQIKEISGIIK